jgi:hypothetical protein
MLGRVSHTLGGEETSGVYHAAAHRSMLPKRETRLCGTGRLSPILWDLGKEQKRRVELRGVGVWA